MMHDAVPNSRRIGRALYGQRQQSSRSCLRLAVPAPMRGHGDDIGVKPPQRPRSAVARTIKCVDRNPCPPSMRCAGRTATLAPSDASIRSMTLCIRACGFSLLLGTTQFRRGHHLHGRGDLTRRLNTGDASAELLQDWPWASLPVSLVTTALTPKIRRSSSRNRRGRISSASSEDSLRLPVVDVRHASPTRSRAAESMASSKRTTSRLGSYPDSRSHRHR